MKKTLLLLVSLILLTGLLYGCADDTAPAGGGAAPAAPAGGFTGDPIYIAMHCPLTGDVAEIGVHYIHASAIAADNINAAGGINGRELRIIPYDTRNDPRENADIARRVVNNPRYVMSLGDWSTSGVMAALPIYDEEQMVHFTPSASGPIIGETSHFAFQMFGLQTDDAPFVARELLRNYMGFERVAVIHFNTDWGFIALDNFAREAERVGLEITSAEPIATGEMDFRAVLSSIRRDEPDAIYILANYSEVAGIVNQRNAMGWDIQIVPSKTAITGQLIEMLGSAAEGLMTNQAFVVREDDTRMQEFMAEFQRRSGIPIAYSSLLVYDSVMAIAAAMERLGDNLNRQTIADELYHTSMEGLLGHFEFNEFGQVHRVYYILRFENGEWVQLTDFYPDGSIRRLR